MGSLLLKGLLGVVLSTVALEIPASDPSFEGFWILFWLLLSLIWWKKLSTHQGATLSLGQQCLGLRNRR